MVGEKETMCGGAVLGIQPANESRPLGVTTYTKGKVPFGCPTEATIVVGEITWNVPPFSLPKLTPFAPVKWYPEMVTVPPAVSEEGVKEVMTGPV
jgi:hypothetical protein